MLQLQGDLGALQIIVIYGDPNLETERIRLWDLLSRNSDLWGQNQALTIMAGDFNMTLLPQDRLSRGVESGQGSSLERSTFYNLLDRFELREIEQPLHTYKHPEFSSRLDRAYVNYSWSQSDVALPFCHRMPSRDSGKLKSFHYPIRFGIQPRPGGQFSSSTPPWITAIPLWKEAVINFYRDLVTTKLTSLAPLQKLALLKSSFQLATSQLREMLRKELIPPEDLVGQVPILQAMLIAVERENTSRLRELAKFIPGLEAKLWEGTPLSTARLVVERQLIHCELAELSEEEEGQSSHTPPDLVQEKEARKEHFFQDSFQADSYCGQIY